MEYLIDIDNNAIRIKQGEGFIRSVNESEFYRFLMESRDKQIYLCSDNEKINKHVRQNYINVKILDSNIYHEILPVVNQDILDKKPQQIMAANAVFHEYGTDVIVVDFENIMTIDTYNQQQYVSGVIYPGLEMHFKEINECGHKDIKFNEINNESVISTANQIGKGVVNGYIGAIKTLIDGELQNYPWIMDVVFTGRRVNNFIDHLNEQNDSINFTYVYDQNLTFKGMQYYVESLKNRKI